MSQLTKRELQILEGRRRGLAVKEISDQLQISVSTTKSHLAHIFAKTGARSSAGALYALTPKACQLCYNRILRKGISWPAPGSKASGPLPPTAMRKRGKKTQGKGRSYQDDGLDRHRSAPDPA